VLGADRSQGTVLGVGHRIVAGLQPLLHRPQVRVVGDDVLLHQLPSGGDVGGVHDLVHDQGDRPDPVPQQGSDPDPSDGSGEPADRAGDDRRVRHVRAQKLGRELGGRRAGERRRTEVGEEPVPYPQIPPVVTVEQRMPLLADKRAVGGAVAADIAVLEHPVVDAGTGACLDLRPHVVARDVAVLAAPAPVVADEGGRLERQHPVARPSGRTDDAGDLVEVGRRDGHVVRGEGTDPVLAAQPPQLVDEPPPVRVERGLVRRAGDTAPAVHEHVEVGGERHPAQAPPPVPAEDEGVEVVVVDVAVGEAHRLAGMRAHDRQGLGVVVGVEQADLAADELGVRPWSADVAQQTHLCGHPGEGVRPVDAHLVGVARVVAGRAGEVAARKDPVCPFAAHPVAAEHPAGSAHDLRQPGPAARECSPERRVDGTRPPLRIAERSSQSARDVLDSVDRLRGRHGQGTRRDIRFLPGPYGRRRPSWVRALLPPCTAVEYTTTPHHPARPAPADTETVGEAGSGVSASRTTSAAGSRCVGMPSAPLSRPPRAVRRSTGPSLRALAATEVGCPVLPSGGLRANIAERHYVVRPTA